MIKKLPFTEIHTGGEDMVDRVEFNPVSSYEMQHKINELVDAVNELQHDNSGKANYQENVQPPYAEQRKWIGKLCKFRDEDYKDDQWDYGLLQAVEKAETAHIWKTGCFKHNLGHWYDFCEPVKPTDDIIYHETKGGNNE